MRSTQRPLYFTFLDSGYEFGFPFPGPGISKCNWSPNPGTVFCTLVYMQTISQFFSFTGSEETVREAEGTHD